MEIVEESIWEVRERHNGKLLFDWHRLSVWDAVEVLEIEGSDGSTTVWM